MSSGLTGDLRLLTPPQRQAGGPQAMSPTRWGLTGDFRLHPPPWHQAGGPQQTAPQTLVSAGRSEFVQASMTCVSWFATIRNHDFLWKPHCLAVRAVCKREIDDDRKSGYSWRDILLRNYKKSQVKLGWLSGRYSNICSPISLPETIMCPMDAETWGEILEAELKRPNHKQIS
ncbi:hypothetical protein QTO34_006542 [Cnephaeus nilssonii]|uniref:Uncharacterized protein n=1 Tax=Cnephaeus nilssonii TaxID=3371016 RepID=A0AA40HKQ1_CNENI|nr:hypothetical protein QTO34_006542 [Eptesicus nilssonii]